MKTVNGRKGLGTLWVARLFVVATLGAGAVLGIATATPPTGIVSAPVKARGAFADVTDLKFKIAAHGTEVITATSAQETVVQQIVISPGGQTGWHSHPGPVVVVVQRGALTFYDSEDPTCAGRTYTAGQVFVDSGQGHVHNARNLSETDELELWATYFDVPAGAPQRIDAPDPGLCSF